MIQPGDMINKEQLKELLNGAAHRELAHWTMALNLDISKLEKSDDFSSWSQRCGVDLRPIDEGGAVISRGGEEDSFFFIPPGQYEVIEKQLSEVLSGE